MTKGLEGLLALLSDPDGMKQRAVPQIAANQIEPLIDLSVRHNVQLAVLRNLIDLAKSGSLPDVPDNMAKSRLQVLRERRLAEVANNTVIANAAREVMAAMTGMPLALVKGLDFAENVYKGVDARKFSDVDLLIDPACENEVNSRLAGLGYELLPPQGKKIEQSERQWIRRSATTGLSLVEIHTDMVHDPKLRRRMTLNYAQYAAPDQGGITNAGRLIVAALHGAASHLFGRLQYVVDGMMVARAGVDIKELRARAEASGALLPLSTMLRLAGQIYGCEAAIRLLADLGKAPSPLVDGFLISPGMVLAAKNRDRWRYLPQRYLYRAVLARY